jgi:hypothetical protein
VATIGFVARRQDEFMENGDSLSLRMANYRGAQIHGFNVAQKSTALDQVADTEGMDEMQQPARHEIGGEVLGGKTEGDAQNANPLVGKSAPDPG